MPTSFEENVAVFKLEEVCTSYLSLWLVHVGLSMFVFRVCVYFPLAHVNPRVSIFPHLATETSFLLIAVHSMKN